MAQSLAQDTVMVEMFIIPPQDLAHRGIVGNFKECRHYPRTIGSHWGFEESGNMVDNATRIIPEARRRTHFQVSGVGSYQLQGWTLAKALVNWDMGEEGKANGFEYNNELESTGYGI